MNALQTLPIVINLSTEVQEILTANKVDLITALQNMYPTEHIEGKQFYNAEPAGGKSLPGKAESLVIHASAAAFYLLSQGIEKILHALADDQRVIIKQKRVEDSEDGTSYEEGRILEPRIDEGNNNRVSFLGISVSIEHQRKQEKIWGAGDI